MQDLIEKYKKNRKIAADMSSVIAGADPDIRQAAILPAASKASNADSQARSATWPMANAAMLMPSAPHFIFAF